MYKIAQKRTILPSRSLPLLEHSMTNLNKSLIFNRIHTNQGIQTPDKKGKTSKRDFRAYRGSTFN